MAQHRSIRKRPLGALLAATVVVPLAFAAGAVSDTAAPANADALVPAPVNYVAIGDSITHGFYGVDPTGRAWRARFDADIEAATGQPPTSTVFAVGGWSTADVLPQVAAMLSAAEHRQHIDLVIVALGTNDATGSIPAAEARYAKLLATILDSTPPTTRVAPVFIGYPVAPASAGLIAGVHDVNNMIFRCGAGRAWTVATVVDPRFAGWIDWQSVPASALDTDGIHPKGVGYDLMGDLAFGGVQGRMQWSMSASPTPTTT